jgi:NADH:ubiquinone oxidoreductase subunit 6 (subunit J)
MEYFLLIISILLIYCALMVVFSDHPINALLFLIGCFINTSLILLLFGLEFIALIFIAIYIGAIAIFFLFIIMMLNIPSYYPKRWFGEEYVYTIGFLVIFFKLAPYFFDNLFFVLRQNTLGINNVNLLLNYINSIEVLGALFYTHYYIFVILSGCLLFFAMVASVMLFGINKIKNQN